MVRGVVMGGTEKDKELKRAADHHSAGNQSSQPPS